MVTTILKIQLNTTGPKKYSDRKLITGGTCQECYKGSGQYHDLDCSLDKSRSRN